MVAFLTSQSVVGHIHYILGSSGLTLSRIQTVLEHGAFPVVFTRLASEKHTTNTFHFDDNTASKLQELVAEGKIEWIQDQAFKVEDLHTYGRKQVGGFPDRVFITVPKRVSLQDPFITNIYDACVQNRVPVNVADVPELCTFSMLSTFTKGDFQLGVTTGGKGCRLANRIKREAISGLPQDIDQVCAKVGELRNRIIGEDCATGGNSAEDKEEDDETGQDDDDAAQNKKFNSLVLEHDETFEQKKKQRMRWLSQIVEYYPLSKLSSISVDELSKEYASYRDKNLDSAQAGQEDTKDEKEAEAGNKKGRISLIGAGPGSSDLLTVAALKAITEADVILSDKLVPEAVLAQIPRTTPIHIAKKFPGNAERAQQEFLDLGSKYMAEGKHVVRLKQGDPYIFGRGAEEYLYFTQQSGHSRSLIDVVPGITSALSAPLAAKIPPTHRDVADQVLICTGTGRRGALPDFPEWAPTRTCVFLMSLHRIKDVVKALVEDKKWDENVPVCVIERASCPDQRVIRTRLKDVAEAIEAAGSRPPGLLVTGYACEVIEKLGDEKWKIEEGIQ